MLFKLLPFLFFVCWIWCMCVMHVSGTRCACMHAFIHSFLQWHFIQFFWQSTKRESMKLHLDTCLLRHWRKRVECFVKCKLFVHYLTVASKLKTNFLLFFFFYITHITVYGLCREWERLGWQLSRPHKRSLNICVHVYSCLKKKKKMKQKNAMKKEVRLFVPLVSKTYG